MTLEELVAENEALRAENAALKQRLVELEALVKALQAQLEAALRAGKRQAAPFSKGTPKAEPKTPGRKAGHPAAQRPKPQRVDRVEDAPLPARCPSCGGPVVPDRVEVQYQVDIPPVQPVVTQFDVHIGYCADCQRRLQGHHPQQTSDALGAANVQLGPRALTLAAEAKHELGVPYGKVSRWFESAFSLTVCRAAWARADQRLARRGAPVYLKLIDLLRQSHTVAVDETGWKVAGQLAWLWVFTNEAVTVYLIDPTRAHDVVERVLGADFAGVLQCDCFLAYDPLAEAYDQQKCLQHLLRRCDALTESKSRRAVVFSRQVASLLRGAIHLKHRLQAQQISAHGFVVARGRLGAALDRLLAGHYTDPDNAKLAKLLRKHRAQLLVFLDDEAVEPTNARAEQEIRPAVVVRKTSACNRSPTGAATHAILTSLIRTCRKQGQSFLALGLALWCRTPLPLPKALRPRLNAPPSETLPVIALPHMSTR
jgi:transposase